jgi:hypothetical protein
LEILEPTVNYLELETSFGTITNNVEIEKFDIVNVEIVNTEKILASDLPDDIPMSKIVGNLDVSRIDGLAQYLANIEIDAANISDLDDYLDNYEFDCGSP